jgi:hypothetical protein
MTFATAVLPVVGQAFGYDGLSAGNIAAAGQAGAAVIDAFGAAVGAGLIFWGRLKATLPINFVGE